MYKLLLSWRYLRTRFIALASIVSVTLGVATLIVVNSVMSGFVDQMKHRLHGVLSDIEMSAPLLSEIHHSEYTVEQIRELLGDDLEEVTCVVRTPALMAFQGPNGMSVQQQVILIGIDDQTFGNVTDFEPYLQHARKKTNFSFDLESDGYSPDYGVCGWELRRQRAEHERMMEELYRQQTLRAEQEQSKWGVQPQSGVAQASFQQTVDEPSAEGTFEPVERTFAPLPTKIRPIDEILAEKEQSSSDSASQLSFADPHAHLRQQVAAEDIFDPAKDHYTGIIIGQAIAKKLSVDDETGEVSDFFLLRPGDDVQLMVTTVGRSPKPVSDMCTVVDFYSSNMHEYDSQFAFMPISELQKMRGMINPMTGKGSVSTIQIKLKPGVDLNEAKLAMLQRFPMEEYFCGIETWQDRQRPLLSAVNMELTILNILLFLIIAVAGFGILATFYMIVVEKTRDIGILKALGAPSGGVMSIFLGYGVSLGAVGTGAGIILGLLFVRYINQIADLVQKITGQEIFDPTIYYFSEIPTIVSPWMVIGVAVGAIAIAVMAAVLPSLRAARLHPVEALRYE
ncbi:ABC transporter permease [Mariniblastus fucicola]|uniref:Lipoprotein-releasing system transmembrane protein LolC n=1 Tax=Mariniblastus fucicola TaxID=980251 RepID=A0A5B9PC64_9BACT|nr:FtsX-like permease family protein [Mariniblastus fucicola]QEG23079.1 Lipoprotein-releasing system transmembrane protein LolC [Mariniblastus fucicola]